MITPVNSTINTLLNTYPKMPEPNKPTGAQIPLPTFHIPELPPEAATLTHLTLTSDIKPTDYASLLANPASPDAIPSSIPRTVESLTLELFSLGYPAPFLTSLGRSLPRLKALTVYSQLIDGVSDASRADAGEFVYNILTNGLQEVHLLDVFCRKGFLSGFGQVMDDVATTPAPGDTDAGKKGIRFLEVSYTYRGHSDKDFLARVPGEEVPSLLVASLVAASLKLAPPPPAESSRVANGLRDEIPSDPADVDEEGKRIPGDKPQGIIPFSSRYPGTTSCVQRLTGSGADEDGDGDGARLRLKMLDCTLYTLTTTQLARILGVQTELAVLSVSLLVHRDETSKTSLLETLRSGSKSMEIVEVVGVPEEEANEQEEKEDSVFHGIFPTRSDLEALTESLPELENFNMNILCAPKFGSVRWEKQENGNWTGGIVSE